MNATKMINYRVSKGYNREESVAKLEEVMAISMADDVRICTLLYWGFISQYTANKQMQSLVKVAA